ncbi:MAG: putative manganese transporter [Bacteroidales bacterium]|nr:putative manganese transporter [Bacteroidales bacterium]
MTLHSIYLILQQVLIITAFVLGMMMIIEFINVKTGGLWSKRLQTSPWIQIIIGAVMGVIPGCLGTYTIVSLYIHRVVNFPALMATLVATAGDESFFMFSLFPGKALLITAILFVLAIVVGGILQSTMKNKFVGLTEKSFPLHEGHDVCHHHGHHHEDEKCEVCDHHHSVRENFRNLTFVRALLMTMCVTILALILSGVIDGQHQLNMLMGGQSEESVVESFGVEHHELHESHEGCHHELHEESHHESHELHESHECLGHHHDHGGEADWIRYTLIAMFLIIMVIVVVADEHFLEEHLWEHVIKVHLPKIVLWTLAVIVGLTIINHFVDIHGLVTKNPYIVLAAALLIGIIPQSGPHLVFVLLFMQGSIPLSILLASSIVQDGHGALPLLAESRKAFFLSKGISILLGLTVGVAGLMIGF